MEIERALGDYFDAVLGRRPEVTSLPRSAMSSLPLYLATSYRFLEVKLFGTAFVAAIVKQDEETGISKLANTAEILAGKFSKPVVIVLPRLRSYERKRLVEHGVPFIVPGRQMFLPMLLTDLRETFPAVHKGVKTHVGWAAQVVILRHLLRNDIAGDSLAIIARKLGYSAMTMTQVLDQLLALGLCTQATAGRIKMIKFIYTPNRLWNKALPYLRSPIKKIQSIRSLKWRDRERLLAGSSALSEYSDLAPKQKPTYAMHEQQLRTMVNSKMVEVADFEDDAACFIEGWAYDPKPLSFRSTVDRLSLYLSLKDEQDERVQKALSQMMEKSPWSRA